MGPDWLRILQRRGAVASGLDASEALVAIARARTPSGDFRVGDMFALPFADAAFDVATSFNGIWKGCEGALARSPARPCPERSAGLDLLGPITTISA